MLGVTPQTVLNYKNAGMPASGTDTSGAFLWDPERAKGWIKSNRPYTHIGGKRPRAGRPPKWRTAGLPGPPGIDFADSGLARAATAPPAEPAPDPAMVRDLEEAWRQYYRGMADDKQLRLVAGVPLNRPATPAEGKHLETMAAAHENHRKSAKARGELVDAEEARTAMAQTLARFCIRLDALAGRASARAMAEGRIAGDREPLVRAGIQVEIDRIKAEFAGGEERTGDGQGTQASG